MRFVSTQEKAHHILRLERGEFVHETIAAFCKSKGVTTAWCTGLGAIESIELGYYALDERAYHFKTYEKAHEVVTMVGNVTQVDGEPFLHIHTTISDDDNTTYGGHLKSAKVAVTLEVHLVEFDATLERTLDEAVTGLKLINCPHTA